MTKEDNKHLEFIYFRLMEVHGENVNADYMVRLKKIIDKANLKLSCYHPTINRDFIDDNYFFCSNCKQMLNLRNP